MISMTKNKRDQCRAAEDIFCAQEEENMKSLAYVEGMKITQDWQAKNALKDDPRGTTHV